MKKPVFALLFAAVVLAGLLARIIGLDLRPMHHDEANQAVKFGALLENGEYTYDPNDHHGPSLYYLSLPVVRLMSGAKFSAVDETLLRLIPALFGLGIIILLLLLQDALSRLGVVIAGLLAAVSPLLVFYSRFYIQEILLACFTLGTIAAGWRYYRKPEWTWAALIGFFIGLMYAAKETCVIIFAAFIGALALTRLTLRRNLPAGEAGGTMYAVRSYIGSHLLAGIGVALLTAVLFYSSFFKHPVGVIDSLLAFKTYFSRAGDGGFHSHPWYYYFKLLAFSKNAGGPVWSEGLVLLLAIIGSISAFCGKALGNISREFVRFMSFYTLAAAAIFSLIPYKTPWNMLPFYLGLIVLAGVGGAFLLSIGKKYIYRIGMGLLLVGAATNFALQSYRANFRYYADERNPYVYAQTVNDFKRMAARINDLAAVDNNHYDMEIRVITNPYDAWPLPWYLRRFRRVGYWQEVSKSLPLSGVPVVAASLDLDETVRPLLENNYQSEYYGLRPGVLLVLYIRQDLWIEFMRGAFFEKAAPLHPPKKLLFNLSKSFGRCRNPFSKGF